MEYYHIWCGLVQEYPELYYLLCRVSKAHYGLKDNPFVNKAIVKYKNEYLNVTKDGYRLKDVKYQTEKLCLAATLNHGWAIKYVEDCTEDIYINAIKDNVWIIDKFFPDYDNCILCNKRDNNTLNDNLTLIKATKWGCTLDSSISWLQKRPWESFWFSNKHKLSFLYINKKVIGTYTEIVKRSVQLNINQCPNLKNTDILLCAFMISETHLKLIRAINKDLFMSNLKGPAWIMFYVSKGPNGEITQLGGKGWVLVYKK